MKIQFATGAHLCRYGIALLALLLVSEVIQAAAPAGVWWDANYAYRRQITLSAGATALTSGDAVSFSFNHLTEVAATRSQLTGSDVRIVYWNGTTWLEIDRIADAVNTWNLNSTVIWFKTQTGLAANATDTNYYLYYGYNGAAAAPAATTNTPLPSSAPALSLGVATQVEPIGEWRLDQRTWNGTTGEVLDSGTNGLHMNAYGSAATALVTPAKSANPGTCRYGTLNGSTQYAQAADNALLDLTDQVSVSVWVNPRTWPGAGGLKSIVSKDNNYEFHIDSNGRVYFWWNGGGAREITSTTSVPINQWTHIAITYKSGAQAIYINGVQSGANTQTGTLPVNNLPLQIGQDQGIGDRFWDGYIDEVRVYGTALTSDQIANLANATHACVPEPDHFSVTHDGHGINCLVEEVTVNLLNVSNGAVSGVTRPVAISTGTTSGTWSLISGGGTLSTTTNGTATYQWAMTDASVVFGLSYQLAGPISPRAVSTGLITGIGPPLVFHPSGFTVTSAVYNPPSTIPAFASPQIAGTNFTTRITAYGTTPTDTQCGVIEAYTGTKNLKFWSSYVNPASGSRNVTVNANPAAVVEGAATAQSVAFTNGRATITTQYKDVGLINLSMKDDTTGDPTLPNGIRGSTGNFVVRPASFGIAVTRTDNGAANPAATAATGSVFIAAGQPFTVAVTALDSTGAVTPNFGIETPAESVRLAATLVLPSGGAMPLLAGNFTSVADGVSTGTSFSWSEVGIIRLTPRLNDASYLGTVDVVGTAVNVGRFIPYNFGVTQNTPAIAPACPASGFVYIGQPLRFTPAPVLTLTARALGGGTTLNYRNAFYKLTNTSSTNRSYATDVGTLDQNGVLPANDPLTASLGNGRATLTFNTNTGVFYVRSTPIDPFTPVITLSLNVLDTDGVAASSDVGLPSTNPWVINNIATPPHRYGRIAFRNAVGSELLNLPVTMRAEYFASAAAGFTTSSTDTCTTGVSLSLANFGGNLSAGETCVVDIGNPGVSGAGCSAAGVVSERFRMPPALGNFNAVLRAPGTGNDGTVTITTVVPSWLRFDWNAAGQENPRGIATFGLFKGEPRRIFQSEK